MPTLRQPNPYLANKSHAEVRYMIRWSEYESSVFEGVWLPKNHPSALGVNFEVVDSFVKLMEIVR